MTLQDGFISKYTLRPLGEVGVRVIDCDHRTPKTVAEGLPYLTIPQVKDGRLLLESARRISKTDFAEWTKKAYPTRFDVVLSRRCNPGETAVVSESGSFALGQNLVLLRSDGLHIFPPFLRYLVQGPDWWTQVRKYLNVGAVFNSLRLGDMLAFELPIPPIAEQVEISSILSAFDDKIEVNRRMNEALEAMARALFKSWFVDFDPVRIKARGGDPVAKLGLSSEIAALFPDSLTELDDGTETPLGWQIGSLLDQADLLSGGTPKTDRPDYWGGPIRWASAKDVSQCQGRCLVETDRTITELGLRHSATKLIPAFSTVVVARGATTGRMTLLASDIAMNQTCYALRSRLRCHFALFCQCLEVMPSLVSAAHGSIFDTITTETFKRGRVLLPPEALLTCLEQQVRPLFEAILSNEHESLTLARLRDYLLPQLLSGQLEVSHPLCGVPG